MLSSPFSISSPVVQNVEFIDSLRARLFEILNRPDNFRILHISRWVIVEANGQDSHVQTMCGLDQKMQVEKIRLI